METRFRVYTLIALNCLYSISPGTYFNLLSLKWSVQKATILIPNLINPILQVNLIGQPSVFGKKAFPISLINLPMVCLADIVSLPEIVWLSCEFMLR